WVIEDDYDGEFHWRGQEIAAMQAQAAAGEALYLGTAAKALMPGLRLGWMVLPEGLVEPMRQAQRNLGLGANIHAQAALADLMRGGEYRAHLRRMARVNGERGEALVAALRARLGDEVTAELPDGGLQLALLFPGAAREAAAQRALQAAGFAPSRLSGFGLAHRPTGLVTGFADATPERIARFADVLAAALAAPPQGAP
ncbi:MAG: aminotransferase class I/II-fold pyridoxal phosphate-dependent enzyme, partial [Rhodobacteraceae bacterium]|nr:aminotransferase class I/II-fold pyridoxal phosphate-dependent enzyme [Paracoccaceae bacterium]